MEKFAKATQLPRKKWSLLLDDLDFVIGEYDKFASSYSEQDKEKFMQVKHLIISIIGNNVKTDLGNTQS